MKISLRKRTKNTSPKSRTKTKMSIRTQLIMAFSLMLVLIMGIFGVGYFGLQYMEKESEKVSQGEHEQFLWADWYAAATGTIANYEHYFLTQDTEFLDEAKRKAESALTIENQILNEADKETASTIVLVSSQFQSILNKLNTLAEKYLSGEVFDSLYVSISISDVGNTISNIMELIDGGKEKAAAATVALKEAKQVQLQRFTLIMVLIAGVAVLIALITAVSLPRTISKGINAVSRILQKMAKGDLTEKAGKSGNRELEVIAGSCNELQTYLNGLVSQLKDNARDLTSASEQLAIAAKQSSDSTQQVASSSQQMARGAQEQSVNAQETTQSIQQLADTISQLSQGAREQSESVRKAVSSISSVSDTISQMTANTSQAAQGAKQAAISAKNGAEKSKLTLSGMEKIKSASSETARKIDELGSRSSEIGKIVAVIDDIAAQTNLLALNAAIEAARAGDQGRGFAVVSDEVRKLAERTSSATKEIADLISSVQKGVNEATQFMAGGSKAVSEGYDLAVQAGQSLDEILKTASEVDKQIELVSSKAQQINNSTLDLVKIIDSVGSITEQNSSSTELMSSAALQVSKSVETVAGIAEENSAATEEVSASAQEMSAQVQEIVASSQVLREMAASLEQSVSMFKVSQSEESQAAEAAPEAATDEKAETPSATSPTAA